jgi:hypothetical protein
MARLFHESFDRLTPAELATLGKWASVGTGIVATTGKTAQGVTGTAGATAAQNTLRTRLFLPATPGAGYHGFALKAVTLPAAERAVWAVLDTGGTALVTVTLRTDGTVRAYRGRLVGGTLLGTSATAFAAAGAWRYLEVGFDFTADTLLVRATATGVTTLFAAVPGVSGALPWAYAEWYLDEHLVLDDVYLNDADPAGGHAYFSGETAIVTLAPATVAPTGIGAEDWVPNTGSDPVAVVDDAAFDADVTYLRTRIPYQTRLYTMAALTDDGRVVDDVQVVIVSRAVSSTLARDFGPTVRLWTGVTVATGRVPITWATYRAQARMLRAAGATGGEAWTIARVNASAFGVAD